MDQCTACLVPLPEPDAKFCPTCGFRLVGIPVEAHRRLSSEYRAVEVAKAEPDPGPETTEPARAEEPAPDHPARARAEHAPVEEPAATAAPASATEPVPDERDGPERRNARRFPLRVDVTYSSDHNFYTGFLENISSGGLFVATHTQATIGEELEVRFTVVGLPGEHTAVCEVRWLRGHNPDNPEFPPGFGCRFVQLRPEVRAAVDLFISHREPIFFD